MFRKSLYWLHLGCGVIAGLVILMMSVTGVMIAFEKQMISAAEKSYYSKSISETGKKSVDEILKIAGDTKPDQSIRGVRVVNDPLSPVIVTYRDRSTEYFDHYTGEALGEGPLGLKSFMNTTERVHRWFALSGESRDIGRSITGAANLMFLFLLISGLYLWFPRVMKWANFKKNLLFRKTTSSRARDYNWHHVMGIWSLVPLFVIVTTATVFYYSWASDFVKSMAGEDKPRLMVKDKRGKIPPAIKVAEGETVTYSQMLTAAKLVDPEWRKISFRLPRKSDASAKFSIDAGWGGEPKKWTTVEFNRPSGEFKSISRYDDNSAYRKARLAVRFLHTGEYLGLFGQFIAFVVSIFTAFMVYTGIALSWRKYISK